MRILLLFTRDVRVHDHPALAAACIPGHQVVPMFVLDPVLLGISANRSHFLLEALEDLDASLTRRGAPLHVRTGDPADVAAREAIRRRCDAIYLTHDVTSRAQTRLEALRARCEPAGIRVTEFAGNAVVEAGVVTPADKPSYRVFTPYLRAWSAAPRRPVLPAPRVITPIPYPSRGRSSARTQIAADAPGLPVGGETHARRALTRFLHVGSTDYERARDDLGADATSRLSPYLRFGCVSANEVAQRSAEHPPVGAFERQLAWRDFFMQLVDADQTLTQTDLRPDRSPRWIDDPSAFQDWCAGETGVPLVDAAMRQLLAEGWMPNRARLIAASYLTPSLGIDWRLGAAHFAKHLVDGDPASNSGNWQWVAGMGASPRRGHPLNMERQAKRFDATGAYRDRATIQPRLIRGTDTST
jgi:deoxyribodipyrimidine photo-lyase